MLGSLFQYLVYRALVWPVAYKAFARNGQSYAASEILDGIGKTEAIVIHEEADGGTMGAAAEAVIELFGLAYCKRGGFFVVEGAAGLVFGARPLQWHSPIYYVDDIGTTQ